MIATADPPPATDRLDNRRSAIVQVARGLFLDQGYDQTTLADVVTHARGSLATLYKLFGNKEGLLLAVVRGHVESGADIVSQAAAAGLPPVVTLHNIGERLNKRFLHPDVMSLLRVVIARSVDDPEFARNFYEETMGKTVSELESLFAIWKAQGIPYDGAPHEMAETFLALMVYDLQIATISHCPRRSLDTQGLRSRIRFFCRGMGLER